MEREAGLLDRIEEELLDGDPARRENQPFGLTGALGRHPLRWALVGALALAGYLAPLEWTGFPPQTLWTWLTLIVLPVSLTAVRLWPSSFRDVRRVHVGLPPPRCWSAGR